MQSIPPGGDLDLRVYLAMSGDRCGVMTVVVPWAGSARRWGVLLNVPKCTETSPYYNKESLGTKCQSDKVKKP